MKQPVFVLIIIFLSAKDRKKDSYYHKYFRWQRRYTQP